MIDKSCKYSRDNNVCQIATDLATITACVLDDRACKICRLQSNAQSANRVTALLALHALKSSQLPTSFFFRKDQELKKFIKNTPEEERIIEWISIGDGPGKHVKNKIFSWFNILPPVGCQCLDIAREMNQNGIEWSRDHREELATKMLPNFFVWLTGFLSRRKVVVFLVKQSLKLFLYIALLDYKKENSNAEITPQIGSFTG